MNRGDAWREKGSYFPWRPSQGNAPEMQLFHVELGDPEAPPLVLVHGFPTSSIDWFEVADRLSDRYRVSAMDFPGFGFSDKPLGWGYSIGRDAEALEYYVAQVLGLDSTYTPPRGAGDPEIEALVAIFSHGEGLKVLHETIQYLVERSQDEESWLKALAALEVPTTFIWGVYDTVSPPRVVSYVWSEFMMKKPGRNALYFVPDANHYLQNDRPDALIETFLHALGAPDDTPPGAIAPRLGAPLLVDRSRSVLRRSADLLKNPA